MNSPELICAGVDTEELLSRLMQNETLAKSFLQKFVNDTEVYDKLVSAVGAMNAAEIEYNAHTLKGVCGNLAIKPLFELFSEQVRLVRSGDVAGAAAMMGEISITYEKTLFHLKNWLGR